MAVDCPASDSRNLLVIDDRLAVQYDGDVSSYQGDVEGLPDIGCARLFGRWSEKAVYPARVMAGRFVLRFGLDLDFITAAQVDPAVGVLAAIEFHVQLEVLEFEVVDEFRAIARADQVSVANGPVGRPGFVLLPAGQVFSIEKLNRLAPLRGLGSFKRRGLVATPLPGLAVRTVHRAGEGLANQLALKQHVFFTALLILGR